MKKVVSKLLLLGVVLLAGSACTVVKEYEKVYLNDPDMALGNRRSEKYVTTFQAYREAAVGANGGKTGGGCGCN